MDRMKAIDLVTVAWPGTKPAMEISSSIYETSLFFGELYTEGECFISLLIQNKGNNVDNCSGSYKILWNSESS